MGVLETQDVHGAITVQAVLTGRLTTVGGGSVHVLLGCHGLDFT